MGGRGRTPILVGREAELGVLVSILDRMPAERGRTVLIEGDAGIGKTRLIDEFCALARDRGARVLSGSCLPFAEAVPYAPLIDMLAELQRIPGDGVPPGVLPSDTADLDRGRFYGWVADRLLTIAARHPVVVVVEDLHWADESTGDLVLYLTQAAGAGQLLLLCSHRSDEPGAGNRVLLSLGEIGRSARVERVALGPFEPAQALELIRAIGADPGHDVVRSVLDRAEGNPFFIEELFAVGGPDDLPTTILEVVMERVARLRPDTQTLLRIAAAVGRRTSDRLLRRISGLPAALLEPAIRDAVGHRLLTVAGGGYAFRHALAHEAVYRELLPGERQELHERIATALTDHPELAVDDGVAVASAELARHWHAAGRPVEALAASCAAGRAAAAAHAPAEAHTHYRRALDLWPDVPGPEASAGLDRPDLLARTAAAASASGRHEDAVQLVRTLLAELDPEQQPDLYAATLEREAWYLRHGARFDAARDAFTALGERIPSASSTARARALRGIAAQAFVDGGYVRAVAVAGEALTMARELSDRAGTGEALALLGASQNLLGCHDEALPLLEEALRLARADGNDDRIADSWHYLVDGLIVADRTSDALNEAQAGLTAVRRLGLARSWVPKFAAELARALIALGRWDEADSASAAAMSEDNEPFFALRLLFVRSQLLTRRGRFSAAEELLERIEKILGDELNPWSIGHLACRRAEVAAWRHDWDAARFALARGRQVLTGTDEVRIMLDLAALGARVEADAWRHQRTDEARARSAADGQLEAAEAALARIGAASGSHSAPFQRLLDLTRAECSRLDDQPATPWTRIAARAGADSYLAAYAHWRAAEALLASGDRNGAAAARTTARRHAADLGAEPLLAELTEPGTRRPGTGLTPREVEVLRLVADGLSNAEIGESLFISRKTASVHVTNILRKLDVSSRLQAAAVAVQLGLTAARHPPDERPVR